eukprot:8185375-Ditylum_brightwellii.AAC.1
MATSNANGSVPPANLAPSLPTKSYHRVPMTPTMDNGPQEKNLLQLCYNYRRRITFPAPESSKITPRNKFVILLSMIGQFWPATVLNAWKEEDNLQGLTNGQDL